MLKTFKRIAAVLALSAFCFAGAGLADDKKPLTLKGKVEGVDAAAGTLKVNNEKLDGWMDSMVMDYKVDNPEILKTVKAGDQVTATVYAGDMVLHQVKLAGKSAAKPKK